jgi:hypothetical protein
MSPFYTECDSQLVRQMAFWITRLLLITIWNLHPFKERVKHFFQEGVSICDKLFFWVSSSRHWLCSFPLSLSFQSGRQG